MSSVKIIEVKESVFKNNNERADKLRNRLKDEKTFLLNLMSSPGSGKTTTLLRVCELLKDKLRIGIMEADIDASVDAEAIAETGAKSIQVHTGGECAMDAYMTQQAIENFGTEDLDLLIMENVGNLVCPAETDTGADYNVAILSVPEGDDKPLKYPLMFEVCHAVIISKIDTKEYFDFDFDTAKERILARNPEAEIFYLSAKTGEGMDAWIHWLTDKLGR